MGKGAPEPLCLPSDEVHLWVTFASDTASSQALEAYRRVLSADELARVPRFRFESGRRSFVVTRAFVRSVLSRYAEHAPEYWRFASDAHGRPYLLNGSCAMADVRFNLSHTDGLIICAVSRGEIGVDTENFRNRSVSEAVAERCFTATELAALHALPAPGQRAAFFHYWTLKEAYVKAKGRGLSIPLKQFEFILPQGDQGRLGFSSELDGPEMRYRFWLLQLSAAHFVAVCAASNAGKMHRLLVRAMDPLGDARPCSWETLCES